MQKRLEEMGLLIGNTPLKKLQFPIANLYAKLEFLNFSGSIKDRPAVNVIRDGISQGLINSKTSIIESSSGNFAIALASICKVIGLKFIAVVDPNINKSHFTLLTLLADKVLMVKNEDKSGGYLLERIKVVKRLCASNRNIYWTNQYGNSSNYQAYYQTLGVEINDYFDKLDYVFVAVSSCGTITGVSRKLKEKFPKVKIIAVDVEGSAIFGTTPQRRYLSGIGSSIVPKILKQAIIDEVIHLSQYEIAIGTHELLNEQALFCGSSTGALYTAAKNYLGKTAIQPESNALFFCADRGTSYLNTVYNNDWMTRLLPRELVDKEK